MSLRLVLLAIIVAVNGFFAAAEVSLVSVRRSRLKQLAEQGNHAARTALDLLANPERLLSVTQLGVTLASLGLGWAGEDALYEMLRGAFNGLITPRAEPWWRGGLFALAFLVISFLHVVIGEVVPKNLAIAKSDRLAVMVAPVLRLFYGISGPFVVVLEGAASTLSRWIGLSGHGAHGHSADELKFIVESSRREGHLEGFEEDAIQKLLDLRNVTAREIMTPRLDIVSVSIDASLDELLRLAVEHEYSRLPVYESKPEHIIGLVHYKDLMRAWQERKIAADRRRPAQPFRLRRFLREPLVVPETKQLDQLIDEFRRRHKHLALVVDEFGTITGLVTLEDVLEQVFGEIGDEHDVRRPMPAAGSPVVVVDGATSIRDLASQFGIELPRDAGFETLAGFLLYQFGYIPTPGESVNFESRTYFVEAMDRNRIERVKIVSARPLEPGGQATERAS
jgi:CBS domain containing-hemolysin-like protein